MFDYTLDKGFPTPSPRHGPGREPRYPFSTMEVGDSFLVPDRSANTVAAAIWRANRSDGPKRFIYRTVDDGVRVWRAE